MEMALKINIHQCIEAGVHFTVGFELNLII